MIDYAEIAKFSGLGKPEGKKHKKNITHFNSTLVTHTGLKSTIKVIPVKVKIETLKLKGNLCFCGLCEVCGGTAIVTLEDGLHHFPHKGPHSTPDDPKYMWPAKNVCQGYYHDYPLEEKALFKRIEAAGFKVYWTVPKKGVNDGN